MTALRIVAIGLIVAGVLALAYGGFTYTRERQKADIGPIHVSVEERKTVDLPIWVGISAIVAGGLILILRRR